ncbi:MAG: glycoside hydrolase family 31 protein [Rhizonema sp. PD38]|nr:glycoside hydrolase family 31 protein [Rhizonema sp. PD38]
MVSGKTSKDLDRLMVIGLPSKKERVETLAMPLRGLVVVKSVICKFRFTTLLGKTISTNLGITNPRPFILTRSGAAGIQRYGAALWSGDIGSNLQSLASHFNAQMHMSFSGIDYYGADIGGFERAALPGNDWQGSNRRYEDETYTQWFANGAWFDIPVRPHTHNQFIIAKPPYQTSPDRIGNIQSNLVNIRQRYELIPYYYSLAYRAHLFGEPVIAPLPFYRLCLHGQIILAQSKKFLNV